MKNNFNTTEGNIYKMDKRIYDHLEITDLKDMLNKTKKLYGEKPAC